MVVIGAMSSTLPFSLFVKPSITSAQDLIGKTIAIGSAGGSPNYAFYSILKTLGLNLSQVKTTYIPNDNTRLTALLSGSIDGSIQQPPQEFIAIQNGFKQLGPSGPDTGFRDLTAALYCTQSYLSSNPVVVQNFMKALLEATHAMFTNSTGVVPALSSLTGLNDSLINLALPAVLPVINPTWIPDNASIQATIQLILPTTPAVANLNMTSVVNTQLVTSLLPFTNSLWSGSIPPYKYG